VKLTVDLIGWAGAVLVLTAYLMVSTRRLGGESGRYQLMNLLGSIALIVNTLYYRAYPSTFVNLAWMTIAIYTLMRRRTAV